MVETVGTLLKQVQRHRAELVSTPVSLEEIVASIELCDLGTYPPKGGSITDHVVLFDDLSIVRPLEETGVTGSFWAPGTLWEVYRPQLLTSTIVTFPHRQPHNLVNTYSHLMSKEAVVHRILLGVVLNLSDEEIVKGVLPSRSDRGVLDERDWYPSL